MEAHCQLSRTDFLGGNARVGRDGAGGAVNRPPGCWVAWEVVGMPADPASLVATMPAHVGYGSARPGTVQRAGCGVIVRQICA